MMLWNSSNVQSNRIEPSPTEFSHTAFVELLEKCVIEPTYLSGRFKEYKGYRLLAIDGSTLRLPTSRELIEEFGTMECMNGKQKLAGDNVESKVSILYDVMNEIPLAGSRHGARANDFKTASVLKSRGLRMSLRESCK